MNRLSLRLGLGQVRTGTFMGNQRVGACKREAKPCGLMSVCYLQPLLGTALPRHGTVGYSRVLEGSRTSAETDRRRGRVAVDNPDRLFNPPAVPGYYDCADW